MPAQLKMNIGNLNYAKNQINSLISQQVNVAANTSVVNTPSTLKSPMIGRIFRTKPGCGSCGK